MEQNLSKKTRTESDLIGSREVPESALYGVQTLRGIENFRISKFHLNEYPLFHIGCFIVITFSLVLIITNQRCYCFNKYAKTIQRLFCCK